MSVSPQLHAPQRSNRAQPYYAGLPDRAEYRSPQSLAYRFLAEARRLWYLEQDTNKLTSVQAAMLLNMVYNMSASDTLGWIFKIQAAAVAHSMQLFKSPDNIQSRRQRSARAITAWGLFNWQR